MVQKEGTREAPVSGATIAALVEELLSSVVSMNFVVRELGDPERTVQFWGELSLLRRPASEATAKAQGQRTRRGKTAQTRTPAAPTANGPEAR